MFVGDLLSQKFPAMQYCLTIWVKTGEQSNEFNTEMHDTKVHTQNSGSKS